MEAALHITRFPVSNYNLGSTLASGQCFRWIKKDGGWIGVVGNHWLRMEQSPLEIIVRSPQPMPDWSFVADFLQAGQDLRKILRTFPDDPPMQAAVRGCPGLRLLRQEPWECLASFILSSTKQIVQIRQIIALLCERFGESLAVPAQEAPAWTFPTATRLARLRESDLRACKMGFRAPYLLGTARRIADGTFDLQSLHDMRVHEARQQLVTLPGVGPKIADCVLLFGYGFQSAFPIDVWILKALRQLYFPDREPGTLELQEFASTHFGPHAGYAQQYLFHYMRTIHDAPPVGT